MDKDTYKLISKAGRPIVFKEKRSKFHGYAFPILEESEVKPLLSQLKKQHPSASHVCYAWQLGIDRISYRTSDDGEPNNTAGMPIYGQIQSFGLTNVLIAVARVYGGIKLGAGGLKSAYKQGARLAIMASDIEEKTMQEVLELHFEYNLLNAVMRVIKRFDLTILHQNMRLSCDMRIAIPRNQMQYVRGELQKIHGVQIKT